MFPSSVKTERTDILTAHLLWEYPICAVFGLGRGAFNMDDRFPRGTAARAFEFEVPCSL